MDNVIHFPCQRARPELEECEDARVLETVRWAKSLGHDEETAWEIAVVAQRLRNA